MIFICFITRERFGKKNHAKRNDHLLPKMYESSKFRQFFAMKNSSITTIGNLIFKIFMFVSRLIYRWTLFRVWWKTRTSGLTYITVFVQLLPPCCPTSPIIFFVPVYGFFYMRTRFQWSASNIYVFFLRQYDFPAPFLASITLASFSLWSTKIHLDTRFRLTK